MGLTSKFEILETEIRCINGSEISFAGLQNHTVDSIKSYEGCDVIWVEEAQTVSKYSWDILLPTIRKEGAERWITFNPHLDTDETYKRFVLNPPPGSIVVEINYMDNPWFSEESEQERQHCLLTSPEDYDNIWLGKPRSAVEGAIYANELSLAMMEGRITNVPYDPTLKVHAVWDMGWNDSMAIIMVQRVRSELRIIDYIEDSHKTLDWYAAELNARRYNWGWDFLPHDGFNGDFKTGLGADVLLKRFGRKVKPKSAIVQMSVENGIRSARMAFNQTVFDKVKCEKLIEGLKRYKRVLHSRTMEFGAPAHDSASHPADAFRYMAINADSFRNEDEEDTIEYSSAFKPSVSGMSY
jgi:phage terminase large subunit